MNLLMFRGMKILEQDQDTVVSKMILVSSKHSLFWAVYWQREVAVQWGMLHFLFQAILGLLFFHMSGLFQG